MTSIPRIIVGELPPLKRIGKDHLSNPDFEDFTNFRFGTIRVVGMIRSNTSAPAGWLCRCDCGNYLTRKAKALKAARAGSNAQRYKCDVCELKDQTPDFSSR